MNKIFFRNAIVAVIVVFALGFSSCDKETIDNTVETLVGKMSATIDGTEWKASVPAAGTYEGKTMIYGWSTTDKDIHIYVKNSAVGQYTLEPFSLTAETYAYFANTKDAAEEDKFYATTGTVNITKNENSRLTGTFNFVATDQNAATTITIANGSFENILISGVK